MPERRRCLPTGPAHSGKHGFESPRGFGKRWSHDSQGLLPDARSCVLHDRELSLVSSFTPKDSGTFQQHFNDRSTHCRNRRCVCRPSIAGPDTYARQSAMGDDVRRSRGTRWPPSLVGASRNVAGSRVMLAAVEQRESGPVSQSVFGMASRMGRSSLCSGSRPRGRLRSDIPWIAQTLRCSPSGPREMCVRRIELERAMGLGCAAMVRPRISAHNRHGSVPIALRFGSRASAPAATWKILAAVLVRDACRRPLRVDVT